MQILGLFTNYCITLDDLGIMLFVPAALRQADIWKKKQIQLAIMAAATRAVLWYKQMERCVFTITTDAQHDCQTEKTPDITTKRWNWKCGGGRCSIFQSTIYWSWGSGMQNKLSKDFLSPQNMDYHCHAQLCIMWLCCHREHCCLVLKLQRCVWNIFWQGGK